MAIIKCPECRQSISDKSTVCTHCGFAMKGATSDDLERAERISRLNYRYRLQMTVYFCMVLFLAGVLFFYFGKQSGDLTHLIIGIVGLVVGGIGYLWGRVYSVIAKNKS